MLKIVLIPVALAALAWWGLSLMLAWENRRFAFSRMKQKCKVRRREHRTQLTVPCKGDDGDLEDNLRAFFSQTHPNFELVLVVESEIDDALPVIHRLQNEFSKRDSRIVIAGVAGKPGSDGQKVHNLREATADIPEDTKILAFADADIRPDPDWLQTLCFSVCKAKDAAANTGYRWMIPDSNSIINLLVYSVNTTIAGAMGSGGHLLIWGGSWAIRRNRFEQLGVRDDWKGTLSDDLVASRTIHQRGERVIYDPRCLCVTRFDFSWKSAIEFLRRQYLIGRKYCPRMFWSSWLVLAVSVVTWWALAYFGISNFADLGWASSAALAVLYACSVAKGILRQSILKKRSEKDFKRQRWAGLFDILAGPLVQTINFLLMSSVLRSNRIWWRGNHYEIKNGGQIRLLNPRSDIFGAVASSESRHVGETGFESRAA